jgi:hypothetical protein
LKKLILQLLKRSVPFNETHVELNIYFYKSIINFYLNGTDLLSNCNIDFFNSTKYLLDRKRIFNRILFSFDVNYHEKLCPYFFFNSEVKYLTFNGLANTIFKKNQLKFINLNETNIVDLKFSNYDSTINGYNLIIDKNILNIQIFKYTQDFILSGRIKKIENTIFSNFNYLKSIYFKNNFWHNYLFEMNDIDWILNSRAELVKNMNDSIEVEKYLQNKLLLFFTLKILQDERFCLFKNLNFKNLVFFAILELNNFQCSCTLYWLTRYNYYFKYHPVLCEEYSKTNCNFTNMIEKCVKTNYSIDNSRDEFEITNLLEYILIFIFPLFSSIGIIVNLINIRILKKLITDKETLYKFMYLNSIANLMFCLIKVFYPIQKCIIYNGLYCSTLSFKKFFVLFDLYISLYIGDVLRTFSNIMIVFKRKS